MLRLLRVATASKSGRPFGKSPRSRPVGGDLAVRQRIIDKASLHTWLDTSTQLTDELKHPEDEKNVRLLASTFRHRKDVQIWGGERTNLVFSRSRAPMPYLYIVDVLVSQGYICLVVNTAMAVCSRFRACKPRYCASVVLIGCPVWLSSAPGRNASLNITSSPYHPTMDIEGLGRFFQEVRRSSCASHGSLPGTFRSSLDVPLSRASRRLTGMKAANVVALSRPPFHIYSSSSCTPARKQFLRTTTPTEHNRLIVAWVPGLSRSSALRNHLEHSRCTDVSPSALPQKR